MKRYSLRTVLFLALCCDLGLFSKRIVSPAANLVTDSLHIPGGIGTSFSLMFLVVAAVLVSQPGCAAMMSMIQSVLALGLGMVGSMGALSPIGYILPGAVIDLLLLATTGLRAAWEVRMALINAAAAVCAALTANWIVFRLEGPALLLYVCVAAVSGALCGLLGAAVARRLAPVVMARQVGSTGVAEGTK